MHFIFQTILAFSSVTFTPRTLGKFHSNSTCYIQGWSANDSETRQDPVEVLTPKQCSTHLEKIFCSSFDSLIHPTCTARLSSAVTCDSLSVSGIVVNESGCRADGDFATLSYHSIEEFREWIREVSGAKIAD